MQSLTVTQYSSTDQALVFQDRPVPEIGIEDVLIKTHAASINPIDYKIAHGDFKSVIKLDLPSGLGFDISGEVVQVGSNVTKLKVGDEVYSRVDEENIGTLAEFAVSHQDHTALKPNNIDHNSAASIPLTALTAYQALINIAELKANEKVFIHAGSGGVGSLAIQLAKSRGAHVTTTTSTQNVDWVKALGADDVIDYKKQNYLESESAYDVVFDTLGGDYTVDAFKIVKEGGRVVSIAGDMDEESARLFELNAFIRFILRLKGRKTFKAAKQKNALYRMVIMRPNGQELTKIAKLIEDGSMKPIVDNVYPFNESKAAFAYLEQGHAKGKVVISMLPN